MRLKCVRAYVYESKVFVSMVLVLIFAEVLGLYGCVLLSFSNFDVNGSQFLSLDRLIVALILNSRIDNSGC